MLNYVTNTTDMLLYSNKSITANKTGLDKFQDDDSTSDKETSKTTMCYIDNNDKGKL